MTTKQIGDICEKYAGEHLEKQGMKILDTNFYCREGELDIVARDEEYIVFVEVKARKNTTFGAPCEAVTLSKQRRLILAAQKYLMQSELETAVRFDIVEILYKLQDNKVQIKNINHIKGAFEEI